MWVRHLFRISEPSPMLRSAHPHAVTYRLGRGWADFSLDVFKIDGCGFQPTPVGLGRTEAGGRLATHDALPASTEMRFRSCRDPAAHRLSSLRAKSPNQRQDSSPAARSFWNPAVTNRLRDFQYHVFTHGCAPCDGAHGTPELLQGGVDGLTPRFAFLQRQWPVRRSARDRCLQNPRRPREIGEHQNLWGGRNELRGRPCSARGGAGHRPLLLRANQPAVS